ARRRPQLHLHLLARLDVRDPSRSRTVGEGVYLFRREDANHHQVPASTDQVLDRLDRPLTPQVTDEHAQAAAAEPRTGGPQGGGEVPTAFGPAAREPRL